MTSYLSIDRNRAPNIAFDIALGLDDDRWFDPKVDERFGFCDLSWGPGFLTERCKPYNTVRGFR